MNPNYPDGSDNKNAPWNQKEEPLKCSNCDEETDDLNKNDLCPDCRAELEEDRKWEHADMMNDIKKGN